MQQRISLFPGTIEFLMLLFFYDIDVVVSVFGLMHFLINVLNNLIVQKAAKTPFQNGVITFIVNMVLFIINFIWCKDINCDYCY